MTSKQIKSIIAAHQAGPVQSYKRYQRYYEGNNVTIQDKSIQQDPDNRQSMSYARKGVNEIVGYMGKPGNIKAEYPDPNNKTIQMLFGEQGQLKETNCLTIALTKGKCYKLIWKENNDIKYAIVPPENMIISWSEDIEPTMIAAYYYVEREDIDENGDTIKKVLFWNYNAEIFELWESINDADFVLNIDATIPNPTGGMINVAEHIVNPEKRNIFYHVIDLIDFQDETVSSNMANEIQTVANAILTMSGFMDDEIVDEKTGLTSLDKFQQAKTKIIDQVNKSQGDFVEWVTKMVQWEGIFGIYDKIDVKIHDFMEIPDLSNDSFYSELSGVAMAYRLFPFENKCAMIEAYYKQGIHETIKIINAFPGSDKVDLDKLQITFNRNLPVDKKARFEIAQMITAMFDNEAAAEFLENGELKDYEALLKRIKENRQNEVDLMSMRMIEEPQELEIDDSQR